MRAVGTCTTGHWYCPHPHQGRLSEVRGGLMTRTHLYHQGRISHISSPRLWQGPAHQRVCLVIVNRGVLELREELLDQLHNCHLLLQDGDGAACTLQPAHTSLSTGSAQRRQGGVGGTTNLLVQGDVIQTHAPLTSEEVGSIDTVTQEAPTHW